MKRRAFTLVEILITVFFIGLITAFVFPLFYSEVKKLNTSFDFTQSGFEAQTQMEAEIKRLVDIAYDKDAPETTYEEKQDKKKRFQDLINWSDDSAELSINLFDSRKEVRVLSKTMTTSAKDIGVGNDYRRNILVMLPMTKGLKNLSPEVTVELIKKPAEYEGKVKYKLNPFTHESWDKEIEFCVYRWYIGDYNPNFKLTDLTLIREFNLAKNAGLERLFNKATQLKPTSKKMDKTVTISHSSKTFNVIAEGPFFFIDDNTPLIKDPKSDQKKGDKFKPEDINMKNDAKEIFMDDELVGLYGGKGLVFSAMPVTKSGEVGKEVFSKMKNLNFAITSHQLGLNPVSVPIATIPGQQMFTFLIKQVSKPDNSRKYYFTVKDVVANKVLYPLLKNDINAYVLNDNSSNPKPQLSPDSSGFVEFNIVMTPDRHYEITIMEDGKDSTSASVTYEIMKGEMNAPTGP